MVVKKNRDILTGGKKYIQQKAKKHLVEEVVFDKESRKEYLTGFHKRKLQRQKKAQEYHKEQERLNRIEERKQLRDERKRDLENQMEQFQKTAKEIAAINNDLQPEVESESGSDNEWTGFGEGEEEDGEEKEENGDKPIKGILHHTEVYKQDPNISNNGGVIIDDETTVTIESLDNPHEVDIKEIAQKNNVNLDKSEQILEKSIQRAKNYAVLCGVSKPEPKKKKKFRYLTKGERKENVRKERTKAKSRGKK
ncbi:hypothetical protein G210_4207 [Candida maltosa Xu316]|uniref:Ribosomal RNA-processing protein 17 n=1 Tax=Candida maltosa (strain Xu316) TaxID=1245528 RepID=M3HEH8_CANMX|nr:hypothetical protein G210_4207 [Candida maltosa Xu316]